MNDLVKKLKDTEVFVFDVDNTLYRDNIEYFPGKGTVRDRYS